MNLITGLALDDIQKIAENAEYKKLTMQVKIYNLSRIQKIFFTRLTLFLVWRECTKTCSSWGRVTVSTSIRSTPRTPGESLSPSSRRTICPGNTFSRWCQRVRKMMVNENFEEFKRYDRIVCRWQLDGRCDKQAKRIKKKSSGSFWEVGFPSWRVRWTEDLTSAE